MENTATPTYASALAYIEMTATHSDRLADAAAVSVADIRDIEASGALPAPTYVVFENAIRSPIRTLGDPPARGGDTYYCPAVLHWVRRAALMRPTEAGLSDRLRSWFAASLREALQKQASDAHRLAWTHLFGANGALDDAAVDKEVSTLSDEWMNGGWAVCLRRWDGYHVVTKDLERARISAITDNGERSELSNDERLALFEAIERLDSVILPFAPHERPHGTPGLYIDRMRARYGV